MKAVHIKVEGLVQGVWFRDCTRRQALLLELTGWVRNLPDGSVEVLLCGAKEKVAEMIKWLHQGSPRSRVDRLYQQDVLIPENFTAFEIR